MIAIETERLILREWRPEDLSSFATLNQDPRVMECLLGPLTAAESAAMIEKIKAHFKRHGFGFFACVVKQTSEMIGFVGLNIPDFETTFTPCVEIGWRLAYSAWGKGYATEAAIAVLKVGFEENGLSEIVAWTVPFNHRSRQVMDRIGMKHDLEHDFHHPKLPLDHPLSLHVLYRISKSQYLKSNREV